MAGILCRAGDAEALKPQVRIGVLTNLKAGGGGTAAARTLEHLSRHPHVVHVETDSSHAAAAGVRELAEAGCGVVVVNGGDGTLQHALTEILSPSSAFGTTAASLPLVAPLRTGRTNMTAYDIGSPRDPRKAIDRIVAMAGAGRTAEHVVKRSALRMQLEPDGIDHWGTFFGIGAIYRGTVLTHRLFPKGKAQGVFGGTAVTAGLIARALTGRAPVARDDEHPLAIDRLSLELDGERLQAGEFQLLIASSLHRLIGGMRPFWGKGPGGIRLTALGPGCFRHPLAIGRLLRGRVPRGASSPEPLYESRNVEEACMVLDCGISLDGEMFAPLPGRRARLTADHRIRFLSTR